MVSTLPRGISSGAQVGKIQRRAHSGERDFERLIVTLNGTNAGAKILWLQRNRFTPREPAPGQGAGDDRSTATQSEDAIDKQTRLSAVARGRDGSADTLARVCFSSSRPVVARAEVSTIGISPNDVPRSRSRTSAVIRAGSPRSHFVIATTPCRRRDSSGSENVPPSAASSRRPPPRPAGRGRSRRGRRSCCE